MSQLGTDAADGIAANQDLVYALNGDDEVLSNQNSPDLYGGEGSDFLGSNNNGDTDSYGGDGLDTLHGATDADQLYGDDGDDLIVGGEFNYATASNTGAIVPLGGELSGVDNLFGG